jgi:hypothetical protein
MIPLVMTNRENNFKVAETLLRLALKAQSQCRTTLESLSAIKNPKSVAFIRQANVANNQQVNNESTPRARENTNAPNELNGVTYEQSMDARSPYKASKGNPKMAALGQIHRPNNTRRKSKSKS